MANIEMNVLKVGDSEFEIADAQARQDVSTLKDDFNKNNSIINSLLFRYSVSSGVGYVGSNGDVFVDQSTRYKKSEKLPCSYGDVFTYLGLGSYGAYSCIFYNGNNVVSAERHNNRTTPATVTIPEGIDGVVFASYAETTNIDSVVFEIKYVNNFTDSEKAQIRSNIGAVSQEEMEVEFVTKEIYQGENLFDKTNIITGEYIAGGGIITAAGYAHTGAIHLDAGTYITKSSYSSYGGNAYLIRVVDENGNYLKALTATRLDENQYMMISITEPSYIMYNVRNNQDFISGLMLVQGDSVDDYPSIYVPYINVLRFEENVYLSETMRQNVEEVAVANTLQGKKICADGDSICYGNGYSGGYAKIIAENNNMGYQNLAVGGGTITAETYSGESPRHWICRTMPTLSDSADYILIEGGVNDSSLGVPVGAITNGYTATLDDTTFYGAIESIFKTLTTKFVGKKYGFIIPHRMSSGMWEEGLYYKAIFDCANKWGVPVLDLTKSIPPFNGFRTTTEYDSIRNAYTTNGDGWHPTEKCYREYYVPQITAWMRTL